MKNSKIYDIGKTRTCILYDVSRPNEGNNFRIYEWLKEIFFNNIRFVQLIMEHTRDSYNLMSLLGDHSGVFDILMLALGLILSTIPENISNISNVNNYFNENNKLDK